MVKILSDLGGANVKRFGKCRSTFTVSAFDSSNLRSAKYFLPVPGLKATNQAA